MYNGMYGIGDAAAHHNLYDWIWGVHCWDVECHNSIVITDITINVLFNYYDNHK